MKNDYDALTALMMGESASAASQMPKITYGPMNEVYLGGSAVAGIQSVMDQIEKAYADDPSLIMLRHPLNEKLEDEVKKAFGFKYVRIEWHSGVGANAFTLAPEKFGHIFDKSFKQGSHAKGFYDKNHTMTVCILLDSGFFTQLGLNSRQVTSMLLHEIGHNFDVTFFTVLNTGFGVIVNLLAVRDMFKILGDAKDGKELMFKVRLYSDKIAQILMLPLASIPFTKPAALAIMNIRDHILDHLPSIQDLAHQFNIAFTDLQRLFSAITFPVNLVKHISFKLVQFGLYMVNPTYFMLTASIKTISNLLSKHGEVYSDSFAATYGYGEDLAFALEKVMRTANRPTSIEMPKSMDVFFDLGYVYSETMNLISNETKHPNNLKRLRRMIDKLERDARNNNVDPNIRKELDLKIKELNKAYEDIVNAGETEYSFVSKMYTKLMTSYYDGSLSKALDFDSSFAE